MAEAARDLYSGTPVRVPAKPLLRKVKEIYLLVKLGKDYVHVFLAGCF
jgi:hypothetical protein